MFAIRADRDYVIEEDYFKAGRKIKEAKKLESKLEYQKVWTLYFLYSKQSILNIKIKYLWLKVILIELKLIL